MDVQFCTAILVQLPLLQTIGPEIFSRHSRVSGAQVVKAPVSGSKIRNAFEQGFDSCQRLIFFQDEGSEIANCKTHIENVIVASSRNAPIVDAVPAHNKKFTSKNSKRMKLD